MNLSLMKRGISYFSIAECEKVVQAFGEIIKITCDCFFDEEAIKEVEVILDVSRRLIHIGNGTSITFSDELFLPETKPDESLVILNDLFKFQIESNADYNLFCMGLKYADNLLEKEDTCWHRYEKIVNTLKNDYRPSVESIHVAIQKYFTIEEIQELRIKNVRLHKLNRYGETTKSFDSFGVRVLSDIFHRTVAKPEDILNDNYENQVEFIIYNEHRSIEDRWTMPVPMIRFLKSDYHNCVVFVSSGTDIEDETSILQAILSEGHTIFLV